MAIMRPPSPIPGLAVLHISIRDSWSDEELVRFLAERKAEDPLPHDVLVGLDFSDIDPRGFTEDVWYLNWTDDQQPFDSAGNDTRKAKNGYWKLLGSSRIPTCTAIIGVKIILEFYEGQVPCGMKTGWMMHEYQVEKNDEANLPQDYKSLCKVFLQDDKKANPGNRQNSLNADVPNDSLESYLQYLAEIEEPKQSVASNKRDTFSSIGQHEQKYHGAEDDIDVNDVIATGDYIELNDLLTPSSDGQNVPKSAADDFAVHDSYIELNDLLNSEASASTSENTSKRSMISEEYFDSDAFLREILDDNNTIDEQHQDSKFSITSATTSAHVVISPSEEALVHIHDNNATVVGSSKQKAVPGGDRDQPSSTGRQEHSPTSPCSPSTHVKRSRSSSPNSSQSSTKSQRERSTSKLGKIGKKYCCFGSFESND